MGKYEDAKWLILRKAHKKHICKSCDKIILPKEEYYNETLGLMDKGPNITFYHYCISCGKKSKLPIK